MGGISKFSGSVLFCASCGQLYLDYEEKANSGEFFGHRCECGGITFNVFNSDQNGTFSELTIKAQKFIEREDN